MPSRLIRFYTRKQYSHVSISLDPEFNQLYSFGRKKLNNPLIGGFVKEHPDEGVFAMFDSVAARVYRLDVTDEQYRRIQRSLKRFIKNQPHYRYNFVGLFGAMINRAIPVKDRYFCSEFVAKVLEEGGVDIFDKPYSTVKPDDFTRVETLEEIYRGELREYHPRLNH